MIGSTQWRRIVLVRLERVAHTLRCDLIRNGLGSMLAGTRFGLPGRTPGADLELEGTAVTRMVRHRPHR